MRGEGKGANPQENVQTLIDRNFEKGTMTLTKGSQTYNNSLLLLHHSKFLSWCQSCQ